MKLLWCAILCLLFACENSSASSSDDDMNGGDNSNNLKEFPVPICASAVTQYNGQIYVFGGSNNYTGDTVYNSIYTYTNGQWEIYDTLPDYNNWDIEVIQDGADSYILSGWPSNDGVIKKYNIVNKTWTSLTKSTLITQDWGTTAQRVGSRILLFGPDGNVDEYNMLNDQWTNKTTNANIISYEYTLTSVTHNNEVYITGYGDSILYKFNPNLNEWTNLGKMPRSICASAMEIHDGKIYFIGGSSSEDELNAYDDSYVYDISKNEYTLGTFMLTEPLMFLNSTIVEDQIICIGGFDINENGTRSVSVFKIE